MNTSYICFLDPLIFFHPISSEKKTAIRTRLGLPANRAIFLYAGRLNAKKGGDVLLRAWALLPQRARDNALLVLVGGDVDDKSILDLIASLKIRDSILLVGHQQDIRSYYWAADSFVLASRTEGMSNALLEAMSCGLPAIVSNVGGS